MQNSCANADGFAVAVVFQIEFCFQRLIDRFHDPAERFQESLQRSGRVLGLDRWPDQGDPDDACRCCACWQTLTIVVLRYAGGMVILSACFVTG